MHNQINTLLWFKLNGLLRYTLTHCASKIIPYYIINEYPKSGGSWIGEMIAEGLNIPFPRNRLPMLQPSIMHGHMWHTWNLTNVICVWRDGRDVLISQYYHYLFKNEKGNKELVKQCRNDLGFHDYDDIDSNLPAFMDYVYQQKKHPRFSWAEFVDHWAYNKQYIHVKYEDMRLTPQQTLSHLLQKLIGNKPEEDSISQIIENHSFAKISGRKVGEEDQTSFMRKGIIGDWKNHFSQISKERFQAYAGSALIHLGYEKNNNWVNIPSSTNQ